jgi:sugar lactone lactonase YvrE
VFAGREAWRREKVVADTSKKDTNDLIGRLRKGVFPPAAIAGAFASFAAAARGSGLKPAYTGDATSALVPTGLSVAKPVSDSASKNLALHYAQHGRLETKFQRSISGVAVGSSDRIYVLGDGEVRIFERTGEAVRSWKAPDNASCMAIGRDERICIGAIDRVHILDTMGIRKNAFLVGAPGRAAKITAVKLLREEILVADAAARCIFRFDQNGKPLGEIGNQNKTRGFILPNKSLDMDVDSNGMVVATDSGRHRITAWKLDGTPIRQFGKFGLSNPEDFVGCCNPVNLAFAPGGRIVAAEKVAARVKVFDLEGKLLGMIGPEHFDPRCTQFHLAVDSKGRILAADPVRLEVKIFTVEAMGGGRENV